MLRRILIVLLSLVIIVLLVGNQRRHRRYLFSLYEGPIRGHPAMQPLGAACQGGKTIHSRHAIVLDAGSTGSRVHIYEFQYCGDQLTVLSDEVFAEVKPGLSDYSHSPKEAARSLEPLLKQALKRVPPSLQSCTPLVLKATAGLRLLPADSVEAIIASVRDYLDDHPFPLHDPAAVSVIEGSEEAVLAWVTVNFLQQQFGNNSPGGGGSGCGSGSGEEEDTAVVMDLGGGSTQIVFDATSTSLSSYDPRYYYPLEFQGRQHQLYQHSYLGYGLMEARKAIKNQALELNHHQPTSFVEFACFPGGHEETLSYQAMNVTLKGDSGGWEECLRLARSILHADQPCPHPPCSFAGIHQPSIYRQKPKSGWRPVVALSYLYSRLGSLGLAQPVTLARVASEAQTVCRLRLDQPSPSPHLSTLRHQPHWCLDLAYIYSLLHHGYGIQLDHPLTLVKQLHGYEAGWSLGSALRLLEHHPNTCPRLH